MWNLIFLFLLCLLTAPAVYWSHHRLNSWPGSGNRWVTRGIITAVGFGFGLIMARVYAPAQEIVNPLAQLLIFISAYCTAHIPPAVVLQLKHLRGLDEPGEAES